MNGMRALRSFVVTVVAFVVLVAPAVVLADGRVALVVGNSTYAHIGRLPNPEKHAVDMAAALRRLGFEVTTEYDADRVELTEALRAFTRRSAGADISLVFYAGHGIEMDRVNYLVPVDARLERDVDVRFETVTLDDLLVSTVGARLAAGDPGRVPEQPAGPLDAAYGGEPERERGQLREPGRVAAGGRDAGGICGGGGDDGGGRPGRNSPYTAALLSHLEEPLEILTLFRRVRAQVLASTNGQQRPHEYQSLVGEHFLSVPAAAAVAVEMVEPAAVADAAALVNAPPAVVDVAVDELDIGQLRRMAARGDARAQAELGERYEEGRGCQARGCAGLRSGCALVPPVCRTRRCPRPGKVSALCTSTQLECCGTTRRP